MKASAGKHVLLLVENASVPSDMRVWKEAKAVASLGYRVSVVSPTGVDIDRETHVSLDGIDVYRYRQVVVGRGFLTYILEYLYALILSGWLIFRINTRKRIHIFHVGNPPDLFFLIIGFYKLFGAKYIFDVHDLFVHTFESKYQHKDSRAKHLFISILHIVERVNMAAADILVATNQSYREYILSRYRREPSEVFVVRNAPPLDDRGAVPPDPALKRGQKYLLVYFGIMGDDDGVDVILQSLHYMIHERGFGDFHCALIGPTDAGASPAIDKIREMRRTLQLDEYVEFTGYLSWRKVHEYLNTADLGLSPDPFTPQNDLSTMQKIMEYMSHGLPILSFNLKENRFSAGEAAVYCDTFEFREFGDKVINLLQDAERRQRMAKIGMERYRTSFNWANSASVLAEVYEHV
jgi:glycosyltransferase involved in cell wall biosynthesis